MSTLDVTTVATAVVDKTMDMPAIEVGADYEVPIFLKTGTPTEATPLESLPPMDLRGYEAFMQARASIDSPVLLLNLRSTPETGISIDTTLGCIWVRIPASKTRAIRWTTAVYDIFLKAPTPANSGRDGILKLRTGLITAIPSVTRL